MRRGRYIVRSLAKRLTPARLRSVAVRLSSSDSGESRLRGPLLDPEPSEIDAARPNDLGGRCIILASHGRTGTNWIMRALNSHPDFFCTHAGLGAEYDSVSKRTRPPGELAHLEPLVSGMTVDEYFEHLIRYRHAKHYVSSHNFQINTLTHKFRNGRPKRRYVIVNITRHPIVRVRSFVDRMSFDDSNELHRATRRGHTYRILRETAVSRLVGDVERQFGVDLENYPDACFLASMWTIMVEADELKEPVLHVPMERLVSDPQYFSWFVSRITEGTTCVDQHFIARVFAKGPMNESQGGPPVLPHDVYASLPEWQQFCWRRLLQDKQLQERYDVVGYDFRFVR